MRKTALDLLELVRSAGSKLAGHWPTLLALTLTGFAAKLAIGKLALLAGGFFWALGVLVIAFAPAALLAAVTMMFRRMAPGQPWPPFQMVLAPFLVIFIAMGNFDGYQINLALERQVTMDVSAAAVLIGAIVLRWLMPLWTAVNSKPWATWVRLGLDVCWMSLVAFTIASHPLSRWLIEVADPVSWVFSTIFTVLIVPAAWLAVGAFAIGYRPADVPYLVRSAGVPLVLATTVVILLVQLIPTLLWEIERLIVGAQDPVTFWQPVSGLLGAANNAVPVLLIVALVAALIARSDSDEPSVGGQRGPADDAYGDRFGLGGRDEEDGHLIGA